MCKFCAIASLAQKQSSRNPLQSTPPLTLSAGIDHPGTQSRLRTQSSTLQTVSSHDLRDLKLR